LIKRNRLISLHVNMLLSTLFFIDLLIFRDDLVNFVSTWCPSLMRNAAEENCQRQDSSAAFLKIPSSVLVSFQ